MTDQQQGAGIALQGRFEQLQRLDVEVVGRFVEHQQVGARGEQACQQQPVALAAREHPDRRPRALRRKEEVAQVGHDVLGPLAAADPLRPGADRLGQCLVTIELGTQLIEVGHRESGAEPHAAGIRGKLARDQADERRLARPVRAHEAQPVAAHDGQVEGADDEALTERLADALEFRHQPAGALAGVEHQVHVAGPLAASGALAPEFLETPHPALVARAARLHALADPGLLLRPVPVELAPCRRLGRQLLALADLVGGEVARIRRKQAAVEFHDARCHAVEERAIVRDDDRRRPLQEQLLQQHDAVDVEVVGRLVEQQQRRLERERQGKRRALGLSARRAGGGGAGVDGEAMQVLGQARAQPPALALVGEVVDAAPCTETLLEGGRRRHHRFLLDADRPQAIAPDEFAAVEHAAAGDDGQQ